MNHTELWELTQIWKRSHKILIWCVASKYYQKMSFCDSADIEHEATIVAYQVLSYLDRENINLREMDKHFTIRFHYRCRQMAAGVHARPASHYLERLQVEQNPSLPEPSPQAVSRAFALLTKKQREVAAWILAAPFPVTTLNIASRFNVTPRAVRKMISNIVSRLERERIGQKINHDYPGLRQTIPQTVS